MRHVRILGLALVTALALSVAMAGSAMAIKNPDHSVTIFKHCPVNGVASNGLPDVLCFVAATEEEGPQSGEYKVGNITVPLAKQVLLQFGTAVSEETGQEFFIPAAGAPTIKPTPELVPGSPISHISQTEQEELGWPEELSKSYKKAKAHKELNQVFETIELAGTPAISRSNLLAEEGTAVEVPVKIKAVNKWLTTLGDKCNVGSEEDPITQHLVSGASISPLTGEELHGAVGELEFTNEFQEVIVSHSDLVDNTYAVPAVSCTGPFAEVVGNTIDKIFGLPAPAGASFTKLKGTLYNATAFFVAKELGI